MKGIILINAYPNGEKFYRQAKRIRAELQSLGVEAEIVKNGDLSFSIDEKGVSCPKAAGANFVVYLDKDKYLGYALEGLGLRLFNGAKQIEVCDDKTTTYLTLLNSGLKIVPTIPAPLCYTPNVKPNVTFLQTVAEEFGFPLVAKTSYGSLGKGVRLVRGMPELIKTEEEWLYTPHAYQKFIESSSGRDLRVIVVGGKAVGAMERSAKKGEFRSNIELGGEGFAVKAEEAYLQAAEKAAKTLGLDYCGVDLLFTEEGPMLCEVNSNAFFEGMEKVTGINIAGIYAKYIVSKL